MATKRYDAIIAGGGTGRDIAVAAERLGLKVALVEKGPLGGTCHNRGCMPSKMLIQSADVLETERGSGKFGIASRVDAIEFPAIVRNVFQFLDDETAEREEALHRSEYVDFYKTEGRFTGPKTLQVGDDELAADKVFIVGGTRPVVPNIPGADSVPYLTSDEALRLQKQPQHLVIVGGGYIAVELAHFFGALGTRITMLVRGDRLLDREDGEISGWFTREFAARYDVRFQTEAEHLVSRNGGIDVRLTGSGETISCDQLLIAAGRQSNADIWNIAATGVDMDRDFIKINEFMETSVDGVWAVGDITGVLPLKHVAVRQARLVIENVFGGQRKPMDYRAIPHAVFTSPQVAGRRQDRGRAEAGRDALQGRALRVQEHGHGYRHSGERAREGARGPGDGRDPRLPHRRPARLHPHPASRDRHEHDRQAERDRRFCPRPPDAAAGDGRGVQGRTVQPRLGGAGLRAYGIGCG